MSDLDQAVTERLVAFRQAIINYRKENKLTIENMAADCEIPTSGLCKTISGTSNPSAKTLLKIQMATGIAI